MLKFLKDFLIYGFASVIGKIAAVFLMPIYTSILTQEEYGAMALITSVKGIIDLFSNLNIHSGVAREYKEDGVDRTRLVSTGMYSILGISLMVFAFLACTQSFWQESVLSLENRFSVAVFIMLLTIPAGSALSYFSVLTRFKRKPILYSIGTMGVRGEALSSICAVAEVSVITRVAECEEGVLVRLNHGRVSEKEQIAAPVGTTMVVERLFENIPARMKFLKKDSTESGYVADVLTRIALSAPHISFTYICDDKEIFATSGDGNLKNTVLKLYGIDHARATIPVDYTEDNVRVCGLAGKPELSRGNRARQTLFVNGRYIKNHILSKVISEAYRNSVMVGKFPFFVLDICIPADCVDVNVHPAKTEIKFSNENKVYDIVYHAVSNALKGGAEKPQTASASDIKSESSVKTSAGSASYERTQVPEKVDRQLVREFMESTMPDKPEKSAVLEKDGMIFKNINFLEPEHTLHMIKETDSDVQTTDAEEVPTEYAAEAVCIPTPIGQVFDTYIVCQCDDVFYMIDQHAAHERLRFEKLKKSYYANERMSQLLLGPMIFKLDYAEYQAVLSNIESYRRFGFEIEDFGSGSIIVNATPIISDEPHICDLILEIAEALSDTGRHSVLGFEERALDMIACKYAIKANHKLNSAEMQDLIKSVWELEKDGICTCPHGRPIRIEFSKDEIEKMFKRKV